MGFRGFQRTAAMVLVSEIGHFGRFNHPKQLMSECSKGMDLAICFSGRADQYGPAKR
jgi:hypothetical protein